MEIGFGAKILTT